MAVGQRTKSGSKYRYHLAPRFLVRRNLAHEYSIVLQVRLRITNLEGKALPRFSALARRKHLCAQWWNSEWLKRQLAILWHLADGSDAISIGQGNEEVQIAANYTNYSSDFGINEALLGTTRTDEELAYLETKADDIDMDVRSPPVSNTPVIKRIAEPSLEFRHEQIVTDPHDGLWLFGPQDTDASSHPRSITYAAIGPKQGIDALSRFSDVLVKPYYKGPQSGNRRLWPIFPGFDAAFHCTWPRQPAARIEIARDQLLEKARHKDASKRAYDVVNTYLDAIRTLSKRDEAFNVFICIVPEEVWLNCRPESRVSQGVGTNITAKERHLRAGGQTSLFDEYEPEQYRLSNDFRRQLKARAMEFRVPIQIVRESTLSLDVERAPGSRGLTPLSDRAWNLSTALYYKAGGKPWRLSTAREGVSYVGLAFRKTDPAITSATAVCAAQMFIDTGDGIVFLGEYGPWFSPKDKQFHLSRDAASALLTGVLHTYRELVYCVTNK